MATAAVSELEGRRQRLALDVEEGREGAVKALDDVEREIAALKRDQERQELAERERVVRETREQAVREQEQRQVLEAEHARNDEQYRRSARDVGRVTQAVLAQLGGRVVTLPADGVVRLGQQLEPLRAALAALREAAQAAGATGAKLYGRTTPPYSRTALLATAYVVAMLGRGAAGLLFGTLEPLEGRPGPDLVASVRRLFEGNAGNGPDARAKNE